MRTHRSIGTACRRLSRSVLAAGAALALLASNAGAAQTSTDDYSIQVVKNDEKSIVVHYEINDFDRQTVRIGEEAYEIIAIPGESQITLKDAPDLVNINRSLVIPNDAQMQASVVDSRYYEIPGVKVAPSKGHISRKIDPNDVPYAFGGIYQQNAFFPGNLVNLRDPYIMRDVRGSVLEVNPFQYNPVTQTLRVYTDFTVEVTNIGPGKVNVLNPTNRALSRAFVELYDDHFLNYDPGRYPPVNEDGDLLVICYDQWMSNVQPYVDHKNSIGIDTTMVGVSTIGNNSTAIKNYLQNLYDTTNLAFVLLVGDSAQVATINASGGGSDPSYALLAGSDNYPDICIGRFSATTAAHVDTQVLRTVEYENMPAVDQDWFWKGTGIASSEGQGIGDEGQSDTVHMQEIRQWLLGAGYTEVDGFYGSVSDTSVRNAVNAGRGVINYCGHGWLEGWSTSGFNNADANALVNDNMLPFIISVACDNGQFGTSTCFAEAWMRATNGSEPTGSIAFFGSSISCSWAPPMEMQDEFNLLLVDPDEPYHTVGALMFAGSCSSIDDYGGQGITIYNVFNLFGDPTLRVRGTVAPPTGMKVSGGDFVSEGPNGGPFTPASAEYVLTNHEAYPLDFTVSKSANWLTLSTSAGTIPAGDTVNVIVSLNGNADNLANGEYTDVISFVNTTNHDGDTNKNASLTVGVPVPIYLWDMNTNPGWSTQGLWAYGQPTGQGGSYGNPDPTNGYTGSKVYGYNLNGDYEAYLSERHLTTTAIDCSDLMDVQLKFRRWLGVERSYYDHAYIRVSTNGSNWTTIWENPDAEIADSSWQLVEFDISDIADQQSTVYIRWTMGTTDSAWQYCGWNLDDVEIWGTQLTEPCPEDLTGDGYVGQDDLGVLLASYLQDDGGDIDGDGDTDQADLGALLGMYNQACP